MIYDVDLDSGFEDNCVTCQGNDIGHLNGKQYKLEDANECYASMAKTILNTGEKTQIFQANYGGPHDDWDVIIWGSGSFGGIHGSGGIIIHGGD